MNAADIMTTQVVTIAPDATAKDAAEQMLASRISALPVVDASGKLLGIVREGDLVRRAELGTARARSSTRTPTARSPPITSRRTGRKSPS